MFWIVAFCLLGIFVGILLGSTMESPISESIAAGLLFGTFGSLFGILFAMLVTTLMVPPQESTEVKEYKLASLRNDDSLAGTFFLASGSFGEVRNYRFYREYNGGYRLFTLPAEDSRVIICEEDRNDAVVRITTWTIRDSKRSMWMLPREDKSEDLSWEFHIPRGSIQHTFSLN